MRILITGFIALVVWSFLTMWLYVDVLKPATKKQVFIEPVVETLTAEADSLMKLHASMPEELTIFFEFDKSKFESDQQTDLRVAEFKKWMDEHPGFTLNVTGNTDFIGTPEYNQSLGLERANVVAKYLETKGIPPERMNVASAGEDKPLEGKIVSYEREKNRRTVIAIKK